VIFSQLSDAAIILKNPIRKEVIERLRLQGGVISLRKEV
jgi:hypothetical protein